MTLITEERSQPLTLQLVHAWYPVYNPGTNIWFEYSPVTGLPAQWLAPGQSSVNYYKDEPPWRFCTNQGNASTVYGGPPSPTTYVRPDTRPGWSWSLTDLPDFPWDVASSTLHGVMVVQVRVVGGGEALALGPEEFLTQDYVTLRVTHQYPITGVTLTLGCGGVDRSAWIGRYQAWDSLGFYPNLIGPGGAPVPVPTRFGVEPGGTTMWREADFGGTWMSMLTETSALGGDAIHTNRSLGYRIDDAGVDGPPLAVHTISAVRHWTVIYEETEVPTALLESAGEASSGVAMRVSAMPAVPELAMSVFDMVGEVVPPVRHPILEGMDE